MSVHAKTWWEYDQWWPETIPGPELVDFMGEGECYVWFCFIEEGFDICLDRCADREEGEQPEWLDHELEMSGWDFFEGMGCHNFSEDFGRYAKWALEEGLAPYQPFRIWFKKPRYYRCSYEYPDEWDVEWQWLIDRTMRISDWDATRRWEHYLMERQRFIIERDIHSAWLDHQFKTRVNDWSIKMDWYWPSNSRYDEMTPPSGLVYRLRCSFNDDDGRHWWRELSEGRSDDGRHEEAMKKLLKQVKKDFPHVHGNKIRNLRKSHW
jgi:hypothetical protein